MLFDDYQCGSTLDNIDEWRWKLTMLLRNKDEQEVVSRAKKDRRDFEQLSALATRMGLHRYAKCIKSFFSLICYIFWMFSNIWEFVCSRQYAKLVVFSKAPLPNYRSDLDEKRPQREVYSAFFTLYVLLYGVVSLFMKNWMPEW